MVRRGAGGRADPFRYMLKAAFAALSPEAQRAPFVPDETEEDQASPSCGRDHLDLAPCSAAAAAAAEEHSCEGSDSSGGAPLPPLLPPLPRAPSSPELWQAAPEDAMAW